MEDRTTHKETNDEIKDMFEEMTNPRKQEERALKTKQAKRIETAKQRLGL